MPLESQMTTKDWSVIGMYTCSLFKPGTDGLNNKIMAPSHATFCVCRVIHVTKVFFVHLPSTLFLFFCFLVMQGQYVCFKDNNRRCSIPCVSSIVTCVLGGCHKKPASLGTVYVGNTGR